MRDTKNCCQGVQLGSCVGRHCPNTIQGIEVSSGSKRENADVDMKLEARWSEAPLLTRTQRVSATIRRHSLSAVLYPVDASQM